MDNTVPQNVQQKQCPQCKRYLPLTPEYFHRDNRYKKNPFTSTCKQCKANTPKDASKGVFAPCEYCNKMFYQRPSRVSHGIRHCSKACHLASGKWRKTDDHTIYYCQRCGKPVDTKNNRNDKKNRKYCSRKCAGIGTAEQRLRHRAATGKFMQKLQDQRRTDIEIIVERCLQDMRLPYEWEKRFGRYWVDFYLPAYHVAIECDGLYWHARTERDDAKRDAALKEKYDLTVLRFPEVQIKGDNIQHLISQALQSFVS